MRDIKEVFARIQQQKREHREMNKSIKEALQNSAEYHDVVERINTLKTKKTQIEYAVRSDYEQKMDLLKLNIKDGVQTMSDIALTTLMRGESIKLVDDDRNEYEPVFSVRFKKTSNKSLNDIPEQQNS